MNPVRNCNIKSNKQIPSSIVSGSSISNGVKGFYVYCIREICNSKFLLRGIDSGEVFVVPYCGLEAVVSEVSLEKFNSEEIQRKAREDLRWITKNVQSHEKVIEEAMNLARNNVSSEIKKEREILGAIPMKFGTILETKERLEKLLKKRYFEFKKTLKKLAGKQEWAIKTYLDKKLFEEEVKKVSPAIKAKEKEIVSMPEGMAYFAQKQIDGIVLKEAEEVLQNYVRDIFETLKKRAEDGIKGKILDKELTGESLSMILNAAFLVLEKKLEDFEKEINELNTRYKSKGFILKYSGPWPPYNFSY